MRTIRERMYGGTGFVACAFALLAFVLCATGEARAQWTTNGNDINNTNTGNVGVGTGASPPAAKLDVKGATSDSTAPALSVRNSSDAILLFLRNDGNLAIGSTSATTKFSVVETSTAVSRGFALRQVSSDTLGAFFSLSKFRGTLAAPLSVANGDALGQISFVAYTGNILAPAAIEAVVNGTVTSTSTPTDLYFRAGTTGPAPIRMMIGSGGNVGIGTTTPSSLLNLVGANAALTFGAAGATDSSAFQLMVAASGTNTNSGNGRALTIKAGDSDNAAGKFGGNLTLNPGAPVAPATTYGNVLVATAGGNVGVGTSSPTYKLDVAGSVNASGGLCMAGTCKGTWAEVGGTSQWTTAGSNIHFSTGNVGIGTATPNQKLGVQGMVGLYPQAWVAPTARGMFMLHNGTGGSIYAFNYPGAVGDPIGISASQIDFNTYVGSSSFTRMSVTGGGDVGVGTASPQARLHVVGANGASGAAAPTALAVTGGNGGNSSSAGGPGGDLSFLGGNGGWNTTGSSLFYSGNGGAISLTGGTGGQHMFGVSHAGTGGAVNITGGTGGAHTLAGYNGGVGGSIVLNGGTGGTGSTPGAAGNVVLANLRGNVGVGTASPTYKLDVAGQVRSSSGGFVFPDGTVQTTAVTSGGSGTITEVTAGTGLTGGGTSGAVTLNFGAGTGLTAAADSVSVNYGSTAGTAVQGNTSITVAAGAGMSGGGPLTLGAGGTLTLTNADRGSSQNIFKSVANASGAAQFSATSNNDSLRFEGTGGTSVSFDAATRKVTINSTSTGSSGWTDGGASVSLTNTSANVGIGTASPDATLSVRRDQAGATSVNVTNNSATGFSGLYLNGGLSQTTGGFVQWNNNTGLNNLFVGTGGSSPLHLGTNNNVRVTVAPSTGNVGIGTTTPGASLEVTKSVSGHFNALHVYNGAGSPHNPSDSVGLTLGRSSTHVMGEIRASNKQAGTYGDGYLSFSTRQADTVSERVRIDNLGRVGIGKTNPTEALDVVGNITATGNISAKYQDVAEWVPSTQKLTAGTVVVLDGGRSNHVLASSEEYDTRVAGVVSAQPGLILGEGGEGKVMIATTGRVKVKVDATRAPVRIGDLLVTSEVEGVAMKSEPVVVGGRKMHAPGTIIGKALEPLEKGVGEILILLSLQ
ncbi:MAG TPA: hypothetical protein VFS10_18450 [Pyrinomonadaceae bacterium]|nr:hypothetical protein [Pyrinomonadaceae bacterium]